MITGNEPYNPSNYVDEDGNVAYGNGLTIRQYFAAMAMQGIKSNIELCKVCDTAAKAMNITQQEAIAKMSVKDADALIAELNKK